MKKYRVYKNLTKFAVNVTANNQEEAIKKARKLPLKDWGEYEDNEDNIVFEAVEQGGSSNKKIEIPFSMEDLDELREGETFDWTFDGVDVHLYNEEV